MSGRSDSRLSPVVPTTIGLALLLSQVPYPEWMKYAIPDWVLLVLFYWCLAIPERIGVGYAWLSGLLLDILNYSLVGLEALDKAFIGFVAVTAHRRIRLYDLWQQCVVIFILCTISIGFKLWVHNLVYGTEFQLVYWQSALTTCLLWPLVYLFLRVVRHRTGTSA